MNKFIVKETVFFALIGLVCLLSMPSCSKTEPAGETTSIELVMPASLLPKTWEMVSPPQPMGISLGFGDEDDSHVAYKLIEGKYNSAYHYVYQYDSVHGAQEGYVTLKASNFNDNRVTIDEPWYTPEQLSYHSVTADQFHMACTINNIAGRKEVCKLIAQYGRFVTIFHSVVSPDTMSLSDFNDVAKNLDEHMVTSLRINK